MNWLLRLLGFGTDGTTLKFGKTTVHIDLDVEGVAVARLTTPNGEYAVTTDADFDAEDVASAVRYVVAEAAHAAQAAIDRRRTVEDAGRLLGQ